MFMTQRILLTAMVATAALVAALSVAVLFVAVAADRDARTATAEPGCRLGGTRVHE
jgi:hypothetical protein